MKPAGVVRLALRSSWALLALALLALLAGIAVDLAAPWPLKVVVDHILLGKPPGAAHRAYLEPLLAMGSAAALAIVTAAIAALALIGGACAYLQTFLTARVGQNIAHTLRVRVFSILLDMPLAYHRGERSAELVNRVAADTLIVRDAFADWAIKALGDVLLVVGVLGVMLLLHPLLALLTALLLPLLYLALRGLTHSIRQLARSQRRQDGLLAGRMQEVIQSVALVQAQATQSLELERFTQLSQQSATLGIVTARVTALVSRTVSLVAAAATAAIVFFGGRQALQGQLTPGDLLMFVAYVTALFKPLRDLGKLWAKFARAKASLERLQEVMALQPPAETGKQALDANAVAGSLRFEGLWFRYQEQTPVLRGVDLDIRAGEHVAVLGASGAGKSSLLRLLLRLYEPDAGRILLDGADIRTYTRESLRHGVGAVLQETLFVGATIRDSLCYGSGEVSEAEMIQAATLARAHEFIQRQPRGYDTVIGEQGCTLSGGERQRLSLARSLLRNPPVLILDEPTSAVDGESAAAITQSLQQMRRGRTTLVIGHQFASFAQFDRIIEISDGRIRDLTHLKQERRAS